MHRVSIGRKALSRSQPCSARLAGFVLASVQSFDPREQQVVLCPTNAAPFVGRLRGRLFHARPLKPRLPLLAPVTRSPTNSAALLRERERERERASILRCVARSRLDPPRFQRRLRLLLSKQTPLFFPHVYYQQRVSSFSRSSGSDEPTEREIAPLPPSSH